MGQMRIEVQWKTPLELQTYLWMDGALILQEDLEAEMAEKVISFPPPPPMDNILIGPPMWGR
jgi:hypothetical protein